MNFVDPILTFDIFDEFNDIGHHDSEIAVTIEQATRNSNIPQQEHQEINLNNGSELRRQELKLQISNLERVLSVNLNLQSQLQQQKAVISRLLLHYGVNRTKHTVIEPSKEFEELAPLENYEEIDGSIRIESEQYVNSQKILQSFPPIGSRFYFCRKVAKYPRFLCDGKVVTMSSGSTPYIKCRWTDDSDNELNKLVQNECKQLIENNAVPSSQEENLLLFNETSDLKTKDAIFRRMLPFLIDYFSWEHIAFEMGHSQTDCYVHWINCCDPSINTTQWSVSEDALLLQIVSAHRGRSWVQIACELKTHRTPFQCFERYIKKLEMIGYNMKWTEEEDNCVLEGVEKCGTKSWKNVAALVNGRTWEQCRSRYYQTLQQVGKKGRWSDWENRKLLLFLFFYGINDWAGVSKRMVSRNATQCRDRWTNVLHPSVSKRQWIKKEDNKLMKLACNEKVIVWKELCKQFPGRTADACKTRYKFLSRK